MFERAEANLKQTDEDRAKERGFTGNIRLNQLAQYSQLRYLTRPPASIFTAIQPCAPSQSPLCPGHRWGSVLVAAEPIEKWYNMRRTSTWVDWEDDCCWHREETIRDFLLVCKPNYIHDYFQDDWRRTIWEKKWGTEQGREEDRWGRHAVYYIQGVFFSLF